MPKTEKIRNSTMMNLREKNKNTGLLIFNKQCIYEISKTWHTLSKGIRSQKRTDGQTDERMDGRPKQYTLPTLSEIGGINISVL